MSRERFAQFVIPRRTMRFFDDISFLPLFLPVFLPRFYFVLIETE